MTTKNIGVQGYPSLLRRRPPRRQNLKPVIILFLAYCCLCLHPGCLAIPIPQGFRNIELGGKKIEPYELNFVVPGQTTKVEFIEKIGQPYLMLDDLGVMTYYWRMLAAYVPFATCLHGGAGIAEVDRLCLLMVSYNDRGVIEQYEILRKLYSDNRSKTIEELTRQWAAKAHSLKNSPSARQE